MQDLKTGHLLGASPRAQFFAQLIGSSASIFVTVGAFQLYEATYNIPSEDFPAPVSHIWKDMAMLMNDGLEVTLLFISPSNYLQIPSLISASAFSFLFS